jgi:chemotaxis protein CheD
MNATRDFADPGVEMADAGGSQTHYLHPANLFASAEGHLVTTVLGTCIAVCLWDRLLRIGGINHYMLPLWNGAGLSSPKFGNVAMVRLIEKMEQLGSRRSNLVAKVFGGKASGNEHALLNIGARNTELAEVMLNEAGIEIVARSVGGPFGRKLTFNTATSEVLLKRHSML